MVNAAGCTTTGAPPRVERGRAAALFAGPPGTGKTMASGRWRAARSAAGAHRPVGSSTNTSARPRKNLKRLFDAADAADVILFFDGPTRCSASTEVGDAHDRLRQPWRSATCSNAGARASKGLRISPPTGAGSRRGVLRRLRFSSSFPLPGRRGAPAHLALRRSAGRRRRTRLRLPGTALSRYRPHPRDRVSTPAERRRQTRRGG